MVSYLTFLKSGDLETRRFWLNTIFFQVITWPFSDSNNGLSYCILALNIIDPIMFRVYNNFDIDLLMSIFLTNH